MILRDSFLLHMFSNFVQNFNPGLRFSRNSFPAPPHHGMPPLTSPSSFTFLQVALKTLAKKRLNTKKRFEHAMVCASILLLFTLFGSHDFEVPTRARSCHHLQRPPGSRTPSHVSPVRFTAMTVQRPSQQQQWRR
jgi:hypothetical protein